MGLAFNAFLPSNSGGCGAFQMLAFDAIFGGGAFSGGFGLLTSQNLFILSERYRY
jgi:hypothetical protein